MYLSTTTHNGRSGIYLDNVSECNIENNNCGWKDHFVSNNISLNYSNNNRIISNSCSYGISSQILLLNSNNNSIWNNKIMNGSGIIIKNSSSFNTISGNVFEFSTGTEIEINDSTNNMVSGNICNRLYNCLRSIAVYSSNNCTISGNSLFGGSGS